jgi:hypothetical protein
LPSVPEFDRLRSQANGKGEDMKLTKNGRKVRDRIIMVIIALLVLAHLHVFVLVVAALSLVIGIYVGRSSHNVPATKTVVKKTSRKKA